MKYKRTLLTLMVLMVATVSIIGGTFAWFTDTVEAPVSQVQAGTLDVEVLHYGENNKETNLDSTEAPKLFDAALVEPGYMMVERFKVSNKGSLIMDYNIKLEPGADCKLADVMEVYVNFSTELISDLTTFSREDIINGGKEAVNSTNLGNRWYYCGTISDLLAGDINQETQINGMTGTILTKDICDMMSSAAGRELSGKASVVNDNSHREIVIFEYSYFNIALHMSEEAGNEYQGLNLGDVKFIVEAKQSSHEFETDAFDHTYDADALWPSVIKNNNNNNSGSENNGSGN